MPARPPQSVPTQQALALLCGALVLVGCGTPPLPTSPVSSGTAAVAPTSTPTEASVRARVSLPSDGVIATEASLALSAFGSVWVPQIGNAHGWVVRIDGATGTVVARIAVGAAPGSLAVAGDSIWVANTSGSSGAARGANTLSRIDPRTNHVIATVAVKIGGPIAAGFGSVFVPGPDEGGSPLTKVDVANDRVAASYSVTGIPIVACNALWLLRTLPTETFPHPVTIARLDPNSGARTVSVAIPEGGGRPYDVDGRCLMLTGENSADETPTESWIAILGADGRIITRSPRIEYRTMVLAERLWIQLDAGGVIRQIDQRGVPADNSIALPEPETARGGWTMLAAAGSLWVVGPSSAAEVAFD